GSTTLHRHWNSGFNGWYGFYSVPFPATVNGASRPGILTGVGSPSGCVGVGGGTAANFLILVYCDGFGSLKGNAYWLQFSGTGTQVLLEPGQLYLPSVGAPQLVPQYDWSSTGCSASRYQYTQVASTGPNFNDTSCSPLSITLNFNYQFGAFYVLGYRGAITV
ncbi:hypothetical protein, partial [Paludisphaera rhizosphaerae]|uniref:hypothetical protein n=1 Tax=Paludisphaera rhizosphaerae TaxID=2711216 RepID=UPI0013EB4F59